LRQMKIINNIFEMQEFSRQYQCQNPHKKIGLVPTMGYLHEGHLSLMRTIQSSCDCLVVSIFVNPIQFNNRDDLEKYPRDIEHDIALLSGLDVDILFMPGEIDVYPKGVPEIFMDYPKLTNKLCGITRPGHFSGMLVIVHNLFQWVKPDYAIFGLKDYQQFILIKKMIADLAMPVKILSGEIIRDPDGLALSSRNVRLAPEERINALVISSTLFKIKREFKSGKNQAGYLKKILHESLHKFKLDYASVYDTDTLVEFGDNDIIKSGVAAVAVFIGEIRLIDNLIL